MGGGGGVRHALFALLPSLTNSLWHVWGLMALVTMLWDAIGLTLYCIEVIFK